MNVVLLISFGVACCIAGYWRGRSVEGKKWYNAITRAVSKPMQDAIIYEVYNKKGSDCKGDAF